MSRSDMTIQIILTNPPPLPLQLPQNIRSICLLKPGYTTPPIHGSINKYYNTCPHISHPTTQHPQKALLFLANPPKAHPKTPNTPKTLRRRTPPQHNTQNHLRQHLMRLQGVRRRRDWMWDGAGGESKSAEGSELVSM